MIVKTAIIDPDVSIGIGTNIWHFSHILGNTEIGKCCNVGQNVVIGPNVKIGDYVKIQNNVSIYEGVTLEDETFCGPSCVFTNDLYPRSTSKKPIVPTLVKRGASIGANVTILCGVTLGEFSMIAAGSTVTKDVPPYGLWIGDKIIGRVNEDGYSCTDDGKVKVISRLPHSI